MKKGKEFLFFLSLNPYFNGFYRFANNKSPVLFFTSYNIICVSLFKVVEPVPDVDEGRNIPSLSVFYLCLPLSFLLF